MKRQELSANRQVVQSAVLVRGRGGGTDPSAGPRRLGRALVAVHLLPRDKENIVLGGRCARERTPQIQPPRLWAGERRPGWEKCRREGSKERVVQS
jgi:hypothetical protein